MTKLTEIDLEFDFSDAIDAMQFDDPAYHGGNTIKRVDFIIEYENLYRFIEVKDPDIPGVANRDGFLTKLRSGQLIQSLSGKYRDTLFFRSVQNKADKKIEYIVLLSMARLDAALLLNKQDQLHRSIPLSHSDWPADSAAVCVILNMEQWKRRFGDNSIRRLSAGTP
ncbi:hypothetical protein [Desulfogranum mediterraneum]|uniref:hypothetical protein n=1 Tax=Desulfogranum mediterraneum TaxID=160661 RepID=UPI00048ED188|nr:hypothetical protein [Desulfogranum mediterraneum]